MKSNAQLATHYNVPSIIRGNGGEGIVQIIERHGLSKTFRVELNYNVMTETEYFYVVINGCLSNRGVTLWLTVRN